MANYILRSVDDSLWVKLKKRAESEGHAIKWVLLELIHHYVKNGLPEK